MWRRGMNIPKWAPESVIKLWKAEEDEGNSRWADVYKSLITDNNMRSTWEKLESLPGGNFGTMSNSEAFARQAFIAYIDPGSHAQNLPRQKREEWKNEVIETTEKLIKLIQHTELDDFHRHEHWRKKTKELFNHIISTSFSGNESCAKCEKWKDMWKRPERWDRTFFTDTLTAFLNAVPDMIDKDTVGNTDKIFIKSPGDKHSNRLYFAKYMTSFCRESFGAPHRPIVLSTVNTLYPDTPLDDTSLRRMTRDEK